MSLKHMAAIGLILAVLLAGCTGKKAPAEPPIQPATSATAVTAPEPAPAPPAPAAPPAAEAATARPLELKEVIQKVQPSVVQVRSGFGLRGIQGSGFVISAEGDIVTNAHVVEGVERVQVVRADGLLVPAVIIGSDIKADIALIRAERLGVAPLKLGVAGEPEQGDEVVAFGSPLGLENTVTTGIISAVGRSLTIERRNMQNLLQITAPIAPGSSGGPLVDRRDGRVIGITTAGIDGRAIGFAITISQVKEQLELWQQVPSQHPAPAPAPQVLAPYPTGTAPDKVNLTIQQLFSSILQARKSGDYGAFAQIILPGPYLKQLYDWELSVVSRGERLEEQYLALVVERWEQPAEGEVKVWLEVQSAGGLYVNRSTGAMVKPVEPYSYKVGYIVKRIDNKWWIAESF